jgi:hypothetical protein
MTPSRFPLRLLLLIFVGALAALVTINLYPRDAPTNAQTDIEELEIYAYPEMVDIQAFPAWNSLPTDF